MFVDRTTIIWWRYLSKRKRPALTGLFRLSSERDLEHKSCSPDGER